MGEESLYDRLGGSAGIETVVDDFYDRVLDDESLRSYFVGTELSELRAHQRAFLTAVTGGPEDYDGADMRTAHAGLDVTEEDFAAVASHLSDALEAAGVDEADRDAVLSEVAALEDAVLGR